MTERLTIEFHRWVRWYPARWRAENGAVMLGTYLDTAEDEERGRLSASEKAGLVIGGLAARLDVGIPATVRDAAAPVMVSLLGAFGLVTGVATEWAPGNPEPRGFGPFVTPFAIVSVLAVAGWLFSMIGPEWLYRWMLGAATITGLAAGLAVEPYSPVYGRIYNFGMPALFVALTAFLALTAARPRAWHVAVGTPLWVAVLGVAYLPFGLFNGSYLQQYHQGVPTSALFLFESPAWMIALINGPPQQVEGDAGGGMYIQVSALPVMMLVIALVLLAALALALTGRRTLPAVMVLATLPWASSLLWILIVSFAAEHKTPNALERRLDYTTVGIDTLLLVLIYGAAIALTVHFRRRSRDFVRADSGFTPV